MGRRVATRKDIEAGRFLVHATCGGGEVSAAFGELKCAHCGWKEEIDFVLQLSDFTIGKFYSYLEPDAEVMVEAEQDGKRFLKTVPRSEAHKYDKAKVNV